MSLYFVDAHGNYGEIRDDLSVEYDGPEDTAASIESVVESARDGSDTVEAVFTTLLIRVPAECAVRGISRHADDLRGRSTHSPNAFRIEAGDPWGHSI